MAIGVMTFDTNILIAYLAKEEPVFSICARYKEAGVPFILPAMSEAELLAYENWSPHQRTIVERFLEGNFVFVPLDRAITRLTAELRRSVRLKSPDASIAATALFTNTPLATRNTRDFKKVPNLRIVTI